MAERAVSTPGTIADYLLCVARERGDALTNLKLQKLLYYAQAWHLALHNRALFDEDFQAWVHGPVLPSQYRRFRAESWMPISEAVEKPNLSVDIQNFLNEILDVFGVDTAIALEQMTHRERPWLEARGGLAPDVSSTACISKRVMRDYYKAMQDNN